MVDPGEKNLKYDVVKVLVHPRPFRTGSSGSARARRANVHRLIEVGPRHGLSLSDQCPRPGPVADRPSGSAVPQRWRVEDAFAIVKRLLLGLACFTTAPKTPSVQFVDHRAVVRRVDRLDRCRRRSVGVTVRRSSPEMVYRGLYFVTHAVAQDPPPTRSIIWPTVPASSASSNDPAKNASGTSSSTPNSSLDG